MASFTTFRSVARLASATKSPVTPTLRSSAPASVRPQAAAAFHQSALARMAYKDDQDRESLKPKTHEYSNEDSEAAHSSAAFDPTKTRPESEGAEAKKDKSLGAGGAALDGSPTDKATAEAGRGKTEDKPGQGSGKASHTGSAPKSGKP
ncbi:uncharacterized protein B0I36DRAFT_367524 [Microdochium trichocladiopsis]|uniref:Uncharacterized protein n=1 Tax=Microdochium trichocladiopsis TaxID=1682393 RepID=A0A9P8XVU0_9PEZI|nr:uncharacterized protein B0I36DRAFT_367524 [Microdochium trichocladiopsis]KAH7021079.1 hypothetical protein B0I36DRAFT_367524 [Microdochium trichocladiopsis]